MRFIVYLLTLFMIGTAVAQNPTILQGNYITNVFGQSNFVLNPNAQTSTSNVTNATRSTTTPLVATSEFNLSLASGANATWTLRAFDQGMKGQNCEARFSYRGFATATTKAELVQNSLVVASLTLTPSTDPRIASINFPCGDLTYATTFRIAQTTANMTGTNEIGGIYVGLATNMANVAQAELVGTWKMVGTTSCQFVTSSTSFGSPSNFTSAVSACNNPTVTGSITSIGKVPGFSFSATPGRYLITAQAPALKGGATVTDIKTRLTDGTNFGPANPIYTSVSSDILYPYTTSINIEVTSTTTKTIYLDAASGMAGVSAYIQNTDNFRQIYFEVYRFPTSSELVVTPERQNVWGSITGHANGNTATANGSSYSTFNATQTRTNIWGKAQAPSTTNDYAMKVSGLPVGYYRVSFTGQIYVEASASGVETGCSISWSDGSTNAAVSVISAKGNVTVPGEATFNNEISGVFYNNSVQDKTFSLQGKRLGGGGNCAIYSALGREYQMTITPLDQPSNSALYVEGPVKASATGAAIPAGYVGELIESTRSSDVFLSSASNSPTDITGLSITLTPGVWEMETAASIYIYAASGTGQAGRLSRLQITDNLNNVQREQLCGFTNSVVAAGWNHCIVKTRVTVTSGTAIYKSRADTVENAGATTNPGTVLAIATATRPAVLRAVRIN